jgi:hypothetical protein
MPYKRLQKRRIFVIILPLLLLLAMLPTPATANMPEKHIYTYIGIMSDVHETYDYVVDWMEINGDSLKYLVFGGDMANYWSSGASTVKRLKTYAVDHNVTPIFTMGNHEWMGGSEKEFEEVTGFSRTGIKNNPAEDGFTIYTLGASSYSTDSSFNEEDIQELSYALAGSDLASPFLIISHYPLHSGDGRSGRNVTALIELLNQYPNVFFFWGHNHHHDINMGTIKTAGDIITPADSNKSIPINFTYCNSGHIGHEHGPESGKDGTGVRAEICSDGNETIVVLSILDIFGRTLANECVTLGQMISVDITAPVGGATPDRTGIVSGGAAIENLSWSPTVNERFEYDTAYTVSFNLKANPGITFSSSPLVTVNGMPAQSELIDSNTVSVYYTFSKTMPDPRNSVTYVKTSTICDGKEYAIVLDGVAMNNIAVTGSTSYYDYKGLSYIKPSIEGKYLTICCLEEAEKATWTFISAGKENKWYIKNGDLYLYASAPRSLVLSNVPQAWTYGEMGDKGVQLHINLEGENCNLNYGGDTVVDMVYPSINNKSTLAIYEKAVYEENSIAGVNLEITAPSAGSRPDRTARVTSGEATAGAVKWNPEVAEAFEYNTVYTATVELTPYDGYVFSEATKIKFNGVEATDKQLNSDGTVTASFEFPETAPDPSQIITFVRTDTIVDGHEYAIVLEDVAMNNVAASGSTSYYDYTGLSYSIPMIIEDEYLTIYSQEAEKATWTFINAGDENTWHIKSGDKYLHAQKSRSLSLSDTEQVWTYGQLDDKGTQLYTLIDKTAYNLCFGKDMTVDLIYPSANNSNELAIYEKVPITDDTIDSVVLELDEPSAGHAPAVTAAVIKGEATVTRLSWSPQITDFFDYDTAYTVNIDLAANNDYRFSAATVVTINGNISKKTINSDGTITATVEFPPTASDPAITVKYKRTEAITPGHEYAITFGGYAMNTTQVTESPFKGLSFFTPVIDGEYLVFSSGAEARAATWTFTDAEEEGKWYISIGDKYLYAPASRTLELSTNPQAWTYVKSDDGEKHLFVYLDGQKYTLFNKDEIDGPIYPSSGNRGSLVLYEKIVTYNEAISDVSVSGITEPKAGSAPDRDAVISPNGAVLETIFWSPEVKDYFAYNTVYTAHITLTAQSGYYFTNTTTVKVNNQPASNVTLGKDGSLTALYIFPKTASDPSQTFIDSADITITAPKAGSIPDTKVIVSQGEVTAGDISWSPQIDEVFAYDTVYTVIINLTAENGHYLTEETVVTVNGKPASKVTFSGNSLVVEYVFSKTDPDPSVPSIDSVALNITAPKAGSPPDTKAIVSQGEATAGNVSWTPAVSSTFKYDTAYTAIVTLTAKSGYRFTEETVVTVNGKPASKVTFSGDSLVVEYVFSKTDPDPSVPSIKTGKLYSAVFPASGRRYFWDVSKDAWYYDAVQYVARKGIIEGITLTSFEPNSPMIRASFVLINYRMEGYCEDTVKPEFRDVNTDMWYYDAIAWAAAKGIIKGYGHELFGPGNYITREQFITILYRYAIYKGYSDNEYTQVVLPFTDASKISDYAVPAIKWAYYEQLIDCETEDLLRPGALATRAEIADVLMRYHKAFINS